MKTIKAKNRLKQQRNRQQFLLIPISVKLIKQ